MSGKRTYGPELERRVMARRGDLEDAREPLRPPVHRPSGPTTIKPVASTDELEAVLARIMEIANGAHRSGTTMPVGADAADLHQIHEICRVRLGGSQSSKEAVR